MWVLTSYVLSLDILDQNLPFTQQLAPKTQRHAFEKKTMGLR